MKHEKTQLLYLEDAYLKTTQATVVEVNSTATQAEIQLDKTIFYPQGGGQPSDTGIIRSSTGTFTVTHVSYNNGYILHKGKLEGSIHPNNTVQLEIDWQKRSHHMQLHTAGHILDQAVKNLDSKNFGVDGDHGIGKRSFVAFHNKVTESQLPEIEKEVAAIINSDLEITDEMVTSKEIAKRKLKLQFQLPENKDLRIVQIGTYPPMPDGGTHLKRTSECFPVALTGVQEKDGLFRVSYTITNLTQKEKNTMQSNDNPHTQMLLLADLEQKIQAVVTQLTQETEPQPELLKTKYLGKKGLFNELAKEISKVEASERKEAGKLLNQLKEQINAQLEAQAAQATTKKPTFQDLTAPGIKPEVGHMHPVSQAMEEITQIFERIGFSRARYPEVDWDWYVFESLNMPKSHPARDEWETFFVDAPVSAEKGKMVLTTHTSNGQVREMERLKHKPPIRMINIARCYRRQQDATHTQMFHQFEGLVVDKGINIQHLKGTLDYFAEQFYGPGTKSRIRPFHFQFTEPSFEVDFSCHICHGTGLLQPEGKSDSQSSQGEEAQGPVKCKFCKSGWHEVGGAGMVHPNVLKAGGIDPNTYTGFAFGWGVERTYTLKQGLNIDDIRLLYSGDLRFLEQF